MAACDPTRLGLTEAEVAEARRRAGGELVELEWALLSVLWSEHCAYKHSRALLARLPRTSPRLLAGPGASAGVLDIGEGWAVAAKIESHNHPSAVEPFQGAATGLGGIMRDVLAMGARPAAFLDALRFGPPGAGRTDYLVRGVVGGISHYGNCVGVPTVGGDVYHDHSYERNPLVNVMCLGFLRHGALREAAAGGEDSRFLLLGAPTGRDGIGGAAFASVTLRDDAAADRPRVQVGDPFFGKLLIEATLEILQRPVIAVQDLGAGGLAGAAVEMCHKGGVGAELRLDAVPLRAQDLAPGEILLSESQERMLLCLDAGEVAAAQAIARRYGVSAAEVGRITRAPVFRILQGGRVVSERPVALYAEAPQAPLAPAPPRPLVRGALRAAACDPAADLCALLARPNLRDRREIYETFDQDVGLRTVVRPGLDAAVLRAAPGAPEIAATVDQTPRLCALFAGVGAELAVCEAVRNLLARGARPIGITNCLNLGNPERPEVARDLIDVVDGLARAAEALGIPVTGGNVSLYNEAAGTAVVPTPMIGMIGLYEGGARPLGLAAPRPGDAVLLLGRSAARLGGSEYAELRGLGAAAPDAPDYGELQALAELMPRLAAGESVVLAHDVADGGLLVCLAELALYAGVGLDLHLPRADALYLFGEPSGQLVLIARDAGAVLRQAAQQGLAAEQIGVVGARPELHAAQPGVALQLPLGELQRLRENG